MESGEYFMKADEKRQKKQSERSEKQSAVVAERKEARQKAFVPPTTDNPTQSAGEVVRGTKDWDATEVRELKRKLGRVRIAHW